MGGGSMAPFTVQNHGRIRSDTNTPNGGTPTWQTTQDQAAALTWLTNTTFRIRFVLSNTGSGATNNGSYQIFVSKNGGSYTQVTTSSSNVRNADASTVADAQSISTGNFLLTAGSGTAQAGEYDENGTTTLTLTNGNYTELEFGLTIVAADVAHGNTLDFRVYVNGAAIDTYSYTPRITVSKPVTGSGSPSDNYTDTASASGSIPITGSGSPSDAYTDQAAGVGSSLETITGTGAATDAYTDTADGAGDAMINGSGAANDNYTDVSSAAGNVYISGAGGPNDTTVDTADGAGTVSDPGVSGSGSVNDGGVDLAAASGLVHITGSGAATDNYSDSASGTDNPVVGPDRRPRQVIGLKLRF